jgi:hypothetical protein
MLVSYANKGFTNKMMNIKPKPYIFLIFCLLPKSPTHTGLESAKNSVPKISCLGSFKTETAGSGDGIWKVLLGWVCIV